MKIKISTKSYGLFVVWFLALYAMARAETPSPHQAAAFEAFAPKVKLRWDEKFLYVEGNGLPIHSMMVGITAWQQQVPLPVPVQQHQQVPMS